MPLPKEIQAYNAALPPTEKRICSALAAIIDEHLPRGGAHGTLEQKVWHRHPVWFLDANPIVGYSTIKGGVRLLFWSGQSFDDPTLPADPPDTKFKSAGVRFATLEDIDPKAIKRWLKQSAKTQWDYKNLVQRKGKLLRLK